MEKSEEKKKKKNWRGVALREGKENVVDCWSGKRKKKRQGNGIKEGKGAFGVWLIK